MDEPDRDAARTVDAPTLAQLRRWVDRTETLTDDIGASPLRGLAATLDRDDPPPVAGTPVPPLWHWLYFLPRPLQREIGPDGHARRGGFLPPVPLPRRMWAGGRLDWRPDNPLVVGDAARRESRFVSVTHKAGRTGDLVFVLVRHEVSNARGLALTEEHDIVYRAAPPPAPPPVDPHSPPTALEAGPAAPAAAVDAATGWHRELVPDDVLLFRYSALTFNGHRIHYDRRYVTGVEGYPGLIVHGPLIATLLVDLVRRCAAPGTPITRFAFRAVRPAFDGATLRLHGAPSDDGHAVRLEARDAGGAQLMEATATLG